MPRFAILLLLSLGAAWACQDAASSASGQAPAPNDKPPAATSDSPQPPAGQSSGHAQESAAPESVEQSAPRASAGNPAPAARKRRARNRKPIEPAPAEGEHRKIVINRGGVSEPVTQIIPGMTLEESKRQRQEAQDLLATAESDLKKLADRELNSKQKETVSQIQHYMEVARSALGDGDIQRAHTLAQKAQLLSDDLVKH
ncbi:MAG TPA: hypothetical protein VLT90_06965 [Terriglobales bacterium]|nr:hypothetical protein [Terriglobales bacterium]